MRAEFLRLCPYGERQLEQLVMKCRQEVEMLSILTVGGVVIWNSFFKNCTGIYMIGSIVFALYLVIMEVPKQKLLEKENQIYRELLIYLARGKHRYVSCRHIANSVLDAAEDMSYEVQRLAGELNLVLMGSNRKEEVREYILYHRTNRYLKLFLVQAYETSEKGDVLLAEGGSLFSENVEHLRLELMEELYRRKRQAHEFAGYIFVAVAPVFMMPVLKRWGLEFAPELEVFYSGYGQLLELITIWMSMVIYGLINKAKDIALFHENAGEALWNFRRIYDIPLVIKMAKWMDRAEGKMSGEIRKLLLLSGERITYGKFCVKMLITAGMSFLLLILFAAGVHSGERNIILERVPSIDTIAPVAGGEKKAMLSAHILAVTKQCISEGKKTEEEIKTLLREKIRLSNETMELAAVREIQSKVEQYAKGRISAWEVVFCLVCSLFVSVVPLARLWFQVQRAKAGAEYEVRQFQSIILMERRLQGTTIVGLLEDMEVFSQSFRNVLQKCINTYGSGPKEALMRMKKEGACLHESFGELADAFLSVDEVGVALAFAEVESNRRLLERMSRLEAEIAMERKKDNTDTLAKIPMVLAVGAYFILPFFVYSLQGVYEVFEMLEEMKL